MKSLQILNSFNLKLGIIIIFLKLIYADCYNVCPYSNNNCQYYNSFLVGAIQTCNTCQNQSKICTNCRQNYYLDQYGICQMCPNYCLSCSQSNICTSCVNGFYLDKDSMCQKALSDNCSSCTNTGVCTWCNQSYYLDINNQCQQCIQGCRFCNNSNTCLKCYEPQYYIDFNNQCQQQYDTFSNCRIKDKNNCVSCNIGYYLTKNNKCEQCNTGCNLCNSQNTCYRCQYGFQLDQNNQCQICNQGSQNCRQCNQGQSIDQNGQCFNCMAGCISCNNLNTCNICDDGYYLDQNGKCQYCDSGCALCTNFQFCNSCKQYLQKDQTGKCYSCIWPCLACNSPDTCTYCDMTYYLDSNNQCKNCMKGCIFCNNSSSCVTCDQGYYLDASNKCQSCIKNCSFCSNSNNCFGCKGNYYLDQSNKCQLCCPCQEGYYLDEQDMCQKKLNQDNILQCLEPYCQKCTTNNTCDVCISGYQLSNNACYKIQLQKQQLEYYEYSLFFILIYQTLIQIILQIFGYLLDKKQIFLKNTQVLNQINSSGEKNNDRKANKELLSQILSNQKAFFEKILKNNETNQTQQQSIIQEDQVQINIQGQEQLQINTNQINMEIESDYLEKTNIQYATIYDQQQINQQIEQQDQKKEQIATLNQTGKVQSKYILEQDQNNKNNTNKYKKSVEQNQFLGENQFDQGQKNNDFQNMALVNIKRQTTKENIDTQNNLVDQNEINIQQKEAYNEINNQILNDNSKLQKILEEDDDEQKQKPNVIANNQNIQNLKEEFEYQNQQLKFMKLDILIQLLCFHNFFSIFLVYDPKISRTSRLLTQYLRVIHSLYFSSIFSESYGTTEMIIISFINSLLVAISIPIINTISMIKNFGKYFQTLILIGGLGYYLYYIVIILKGDHLDNTNNGNISWFFIMLAVDIILISNIIAFCQVKLAISIVQSQNSSNISNSFVDKLFKFFRIKQVLQNINW
ncbi:hypothetical protein ABPG74_018591 [Tetrahymena malaccensis]